MKPSPPPAPPSPGRASRIRFLAIFLGIAFGLIALYHYPYPNGSWPRQATGAYLRMYAAAVGTALRLFDRNVVVSGVDIQGRFPLKVVRSCDAAEAMALLVAAVMAFPVPWRRRLLGLAGCAASLFAVNVARICSLYVVGVLRPDQFDLAHEGVWPVVIIAVAVLVFLIWARWAEEAPRAGKAASA